MLDVWHGLKSRHEFRAQKGCAVTMGVNVLKLPKNKNIKINKKQFTWYRCWWRLWLGHWKREITVNITCESNTRNLNLKTVVEGYRFLAFCRLSRNPLCTRHVVILCTCKPSSRGKRIQVCICRVDEQTLVNQTASFHVFSACSETKVSIPLIITVKKMESNVVPGSTDIRSWQAEKQNLQVVWNVENQPRKHKTMQGKENFKDLGGLNG